MIIAKLPDGRAVQYETSQGAVEDGLPYGDFELIPEGVGILKTDLKSLWWEAIPQLPMEELKQSKLLTLSQTCNSTITAGCTVTLTDSTTGHISMTDEDQINLLSAMSAIKTGATGYPYHLDGELCKMYSAEDITIMVTAATNHKLYHTTYYNHLKVWVNRCETIEEVNAITYGSELPTDLAQNMAEVLGNAQ